MRATPTIADYLVPVNADTPSVEVILLSERDDQINPAGIRALASSAMSAPTRPSAIRSSTPPASASASCRCGWRSSRSDARRSRARPRRGANQHGAGDLPRRRGDRRHLQDRR